MKAKYAAEIRKGIVEARRRLARPRPHTLVAVIYNSRHYSGLAVYAISEYARRHQHASHSRDTNSH